MSQELTTHQALETFLRGFSTTRSFTRPFPYRKLSETLWLLADADAKPGRERTSELIACGATPEEVLAMRRQEQIGKHVLCALLEDPDAVLETSAAFKQSGYRLARREPLFVLNLAERAAFSAYPARRVADADGAAAVAKAARSRQLLPEHFTDGDSICRLYAAFDGERPIGWVSSIRAHPECAWVSNLFVHPDFRRRGIGRALMSAMLDDDAKYGAQWSVLLASLTGAKLYPHLGYRERGLLLVFTPRADGPA